MDCNCNCFGIAASSKRPVKRYNLLVPDIFPKTPPPYQERLDISTERKLKKLFEYLEKNLNRGPKISRRLARRVNKDAAAGKWGFVQIAVAAYIYLLEHLAPGDSSLFGKELVCQRVARPTHFYDAAIPCAGGENTFPIREPDTPPEIEDGMSRNLRQGFDPHKDSVVGVLLNSHSAEMRTLGAKLLASFVKQQSTAEYLAHTESYVDLLCQNLEAGPSSGQPGVHSMQLASLEALQEHIRLCTRAAMPRRSPAKVAPILLGILAATSPESQPSASDGMNPASDREDGDAAVPNGGSPQNDKLASGGGDLKTACEDTFRDLCRLAQGPAQGKLLFEWILAWMDRTDAWSLHGKPAYQRSLQFLQQACIDEQQQYLAFTALLKYTVAVKPLLQHKQVSVARTACQEGLRLPRVLRSAAFVAAIKEWGPVIGGGSSESEGNAMPPVLLDCIEQLARGLEDKQHLIEAMARVATKTPPTPSDTTQGTLNCLAAAAQALPALPDEDTGGIILQGLLQELGPFALHAPPDLQISALKIITLLSLLPQIYSIDPQTLRLLSLIWQKAVQAEFMDSAVTGSLDDFLQALSSTAPQSSCSAAAGLLRALEAETLGASGSQTSMRPPRHNLAILLFCFRGWHYLGARWGRPYTEVTIHEGLLGEASHAQLSQSQPTSEAQAEAMLTRLQAFAMSEDRILLLDGLSKQSVHEGDDAKNVWLSPFSPMPVSLLLPKGRVTDAWLGGQPGSRAPTADQLIAPSQNVPPVLLENSASVAKTETLSLATYKALLQTAEAEAQQMKESAGKMSPSEQQHGLSEEAIKILSAVDALLSREEEFRADQFDTDISYE